MHKKGRVRKGKKERKEHTTVAKACLLASSTYLTIHNDLAICCGEGLDPCGLFFLERGRFCRHRLHVHGLRLEIQHPSSSSPTRFRFSSAFRVCVHREPKKRLSLRSVRAGGREETSTPMPASFSSFCCRQVSWSWRRRNPFFARRQFTRKRAFLCVSLVPLRKWMLIVEENERATCDLGFWGDFVCFRSLGVWGWREEGMFNVP